MCFFFGKPVHKTVSVCQTYTNCLVFTKQYTLEMLYITLMLYVMCYKMLYFYTDGNNISVKSVVPFQPHGDNYCKKDHVSKKFEEINIPVSLHALK